MHERGKRKKHDWSKGEETEEGEKTTTTEKWRKRKKVNK